ncbi:HXXXD-type acyl-transferase family protein [Forsythia ovata]|uniref:HXXXD-type acyl-transferase family protein n=1 Tax=Forsythia ovata TaxID=205694 RepID=A0ABD1UCK6_9LAMI
MNFFPPLAGRLGIDKFEDQTECFFIDCNNSGAQFTHAIVHGLTVNDVLTPKYVPEIVYSFFPFNGILDCEGTVNPLLAIQVTELEDGYFIGCSMNHCIADGTSFWHFFNSWSEISQGFDHPSKLPSLVRGFAPDHLNRPVKIPSLEKEFCDEFSQPPLKERVFHFSKENIAKIKSKANDEIGTTSSISSLQALLAHIWRSVIRCRRIDNANEKITFILHVGARNRLCPPLPEGYFGNAIHGGVLMSTPNELVSHGLGWTAQKLNQIIAAQTHEETRNFYVEWLKCPLIVKKDKWTNIFVVGSSPRFNVYGNDFGWGKPVAVRSGLGNKFDGKFTVFPGFEQESIDIEICLSPDTLCAMENDVEFMQSVTIK